MTRPSHSLQGLFADRYMIERAVGRGASACVYAAHDTKQDRRIALKVLAGELANALGAKRFLQEIHITSRLQHPHILPIYDSGEWDGLLYYVLPFIAGESLREKLSREKQLPIEECVQLTCDVASALAHAHSKGIIHRDVKPENILLSEGHALVADFGIARAIDVHTGERLTSSGLIVGTSQYMSPEQASGEREIDARSDIYSLGCVLYEMLAGIEPFVGPNVQAVIAQRFTHTPPPIRTYRPAVPDHLVSVLERALAVSPADRFQTMKEFESALPATTESPRERRRPGRSLRDSLRTPKGRAAAVGAVALASVMTAAVMTGITDLGGIFARDPQLDSSLYVVLPLVDRSGTVSSTGKQTADLIYNAMHEWDDLNVVPDRTIDEVLEKSGNPKKVSDALKRAKEVGAGKMIWGTRNPPNGRLQVWDVKSGTRIREVPDEKLDSSPRAATMVRLFRDPTWPAEADAALGRTKSFTAWQAYGRGHAALKKWDVVTALKEFDGAAAKDNQFASARLWSAQIRAWMEEPSTADSIAMTRDALFAAAHDSLLPAKEFRLARALTALAAGDFANACSEYRRMIALDSTQFIAWHGLGKCEMQDGTVVRSANSPSGWVFRTSWADAARNFQRALQLDSHAHSVVTFTQMQTVLATSPTRIRAGRDPLTAVRYAAYPVLRGDTIAYIPYPLATFATVTVRGKHDALDRNAVTLLAYTRSWIEAEPESPIAWEAHGALLETVGQIALNVGGAESNASGAVRKALGLTSLPETRVRLFAREVRLRLKRGEFAAASRLADSVLASTPDSIGTLHLLPLTALSGNIERMTVLLQRKQANWMPLAAEQYSLMPDLVATASAMFARAALGDCSASANLEKTFNDQIESYVSAEKRPAVLHILTSRTFSMLTPCTGGASATKIGNPENLLYRLQQAFAKRDSRRFKLLSDSLEMIRAESRPGDRPADFTYQEAWLLAATGDTAAAVKKLDLALNALPSMSAFTLAQPAAAAAIGRMMVLRAEIASKTGDARTAHIWARAVIDLWRFASKQLQPTVTRMRALAAAN